MEGTRVEIYNELSILVKKLMDLIYGSEETFVKALEEEQHPLEPYLIQFDRNMGTEIVLVIGNRIGLEVTDDPNYPPTEQFIDDIGIFLGLESLLPVKTEILIDMNRSEFDQLVLKYGGIPSEHFYLNRLLKTVDMI